MTTTNNPTIAVIHTDRKYGVAGQLEVFSNISDAIRATDEPMYGCYVTMMTADRVLYTTVPGVEDIMDEPKWILGTVNLNAVRDAVSEFESNKA